MSRKVCLITGVGPGTGRSLVERFAAGGYQVAMMARSKERLDDIAKSVPAARSFPCDVTDLPTVSTAIDTIERDLGAVDVLVHNAIGGAFGDFLDIDPGVLERNFQINTMALLHLAQRIAPAMIEKGSGAILATGNTSAYRGRPLFAGFAPSKAAQRILLESIARKAGPLGVHAAYIAVDAVIDVPWTRKTFADKPDDFFASPADIADEVFHVAHQPRSTWSFDVVIRPHRENW